MIDKILPAATDGKCSKCGSPDMLLAEDRTFYSTVEFEGGEWVEGCVTEEASSAEDAVRFFCTACGAYHAMMNFELRAVSPEAFAEYIQFRQDNPTASNAEALASIGEEPYSTSTAPFKTGRSDTRDQNNIIENASAN